MSERKIDYTAWFFLQEFADGNALFAVEKFADIYYIYVVDKLIYVAKLKPQPLKSIWIFETEIRVYRSKGLLAHLLKRKHFTAVKYFDYIPDVIENPDYAGVYEGQIELVKCFKDNIFLSIKLDVSKKKYYVATVYDVTQSKIDSYCKSGRLCRIKRDVEKRGRRRRKKIDEPEVYPYTKNEI